MLLFPLSISTVESNQRLKAIAHGGYCIGFQSKKLCSFKFFVCKTYFTLPSPTHYLASYIIHANQDLNFDVCTWWNTFVTGSDDGTTCESNCDRVWDCAKRKWDNTDCVSKRNQCYEFWDCRRGCVFCAQIFPVLPNCIKIWSAWVLWVHNIGTQEPTTVLGWVQLTDWGYDGPWTGGFIRHYFGKVARHR